MLRIGMLTSGGDCQALNAAMRGVVKGLFQARKDVEIYGFEEGYKGLIYSNFRMLKAEDFSGILTVGGTMLGTSRQPFKLMRVPDENGLDKVVCIVEVDGPLVVGLGDVLGQQDAPGQVPAHLAGDVVPLGGSDHGVLVGVFLGQLLIFVAEQGEDGLVGGVGFAHQGPVIAVDDVGLGQQELILRYQGLLHHVLDVLHQQALAPAGLDAVDDGVDARLLDAVLLRDLGVGLLDGELDLAAVVVHDGPVPLDDFDGAHGVLLSLESFVSG